jgi:hypothetical protein
VENIAAATTSNFFKLFSIKEVTSNVKH